MYLLNRDDHPRQRLFASGVGTSELGTEVVEDRANGISKGVLISHKVSRHTQRDPEYPRQRNVLHLYASNH